MKVAAFIDYSDPLGGVLSWIVDALGRAPAIELTLVGVVTDDARVAWASRIDEDAPAPVVRLHPREVEAALSVDRIEELPDPVRALVSEVDVFIPNAYETGYRLAALARRLGRQGSVVAFTHTDEPHYYYLIERYEPLITRFLAADSRSYQGTLARAPHRSAALVKAPHGIHAPQAIDLGRDATTLRLVYPGRVVHRQKRVFDLVGVARALRLLGVRFEIDVIGDGEDRVELERRAAEAAPEIHCLGPRRRHEVLALYPDYHGLLVCSEFDGMSVALLEAMAHGVVPVVTRVGGVPDLITDGVEGYTWPVGDVARAAQILAALAEDPARVRASAEAARRRVLKDHAPEAASIRLIEVLADAARAPAGSRDDARAALADPRRSPWFPES